MTHHFLSGALAGAAGTTALNAVTYLDMALRARPASTSPEQTVYHMEELAATSLDEAGSDTDVGGNRRSGIGALLGIATGITTGVLYGMVRSRCPRIPTAVMALGAGAAANVGSVAPMTALGVSDPRQWSGESWTMDLVPHLAYGVVTAITYERLAAGAN